jgi:hypothetical protein
MPLTALDDELDEEQWRPMSRPVIVGEHAFATQTAAREACRALIYGNLGPLDGERLAFARDLLDCYPRRDIKIGRGVAAIEVRVKPVFPSKRGLWAVREDGTVTDFSFNECLKPADHRHRVLRAMRVAVTEQILDHKQRQFTGSSRVVCAVTGEPLTYRHCHVDHHDPTFYEMAGAFVADEGGWDAMRLGESADGVIGVQLADSDQQARWSAYHRQLAHLRLVTPLSNLSTLRVNQPRPTKEAIG